MDRTTRWETAAIREKPRRSSPPGVSQRRSSESPPSNDADWVTLQEAHSATGIPVNTLRKWARRATVPSYLESDGELTLRMVDLGAVRKRAEALGRPTPPPQVATREQAVASEPRAPSAPVGTMIVPIDAWNKMLIQLGNLHEAGQQLAEARERAAKAETEVAFLRERLAEARAERAPAPPEEPAVDLPTMQQLEPPEVAPPAEEGTRFWRYVYRGWRARRR